MPKESQRQRRQPKRNGGRPSEDQGRGQGSGGTHPDGAHSDAMLDLRAGRLAFQAAAGLATGRSAWFQAAFPGVLPGKTASKMTDKSEAILHMLWNDDDFDSLSLFFRGVAIETIHVEGDAALLLLQVYMYMEEHATSSTALCELQSLVCFFQGFQLSSNLMNIEDFSAAERAVELFAFGFILSDTAFSLLMNTSGMAFRFGGCDALMRCSDRVLAKAPQHLPALLVRSRLQFGDDLAKLKVQQKCSQVIESNLREEWSKWKARLHEMIGLTFGGMGDHRAAAEQYAICLRCGGSRRSVYLRAQSLNAIGNRKEATGLLDEFLISVAQKKEYDDYWFPNALYLKGVIMAAAKVFDAAHDCCKQAVVAETHRCPFFTPVSSVAKASLQRMCHVAFGNDTERERALCEFAKKYQMRGTMPEQQRTSDHSVSLSDVTSEDLAADTPIGESRSSGSSELRVHIFEFSRHPAALREALLHGDDLASCRDSLAAHGFEPELPSGAKVFTDPEDFNLVLDALHDQHLKPWHVVVSSQFVDAVHAAVGSLRSKDQVRQKSNSTVDVSKRTCQSCGKSHPRFFICGRRRAAHYCSRECQRAAYEQHSQSCPISYDLPVIVSKTFLDIRLPRSTTRSAVTKSTTDADLRKGVNPRG